MNPTATADSTATAKRLRRVFLLPAWVVIAGLFVAPVILVVGYSLLTRGTYGGVQPPLSLSSYWQLADPLYLAVFWRSVWIAGLATGLCLILGLPLAWFIARAGRRKHFYLLLVILPFWSSFLVRTYAWIFLLRETGLINSILTALGWIAEPLPLLYNSGAVLLGLVYGYLPFMVLPLYATFERLDWRLVEAALDLGARPLTVFFRVVLPLSVPGIAAGSLLVFIPCLGAYITPDLLGGGKTILIGNLIQNQFTSARNWPLGSAASCLVLIAVVAAMVLLRRRRELEPT